MYICPLYNNSGFIYRQSRVTSLGITHVVISKTGHPAAPCRHLAATLWRRRGWVPYVSAG